MKKNYINLLLVLVFGLFFNFSSFGQVLVATFDSGTVPYSNDVQIAIQNVLGNDTLDGIPVTLSDVTITQVSSTAGISIEPNGSVVVNPNTPPGTYTLGYTICLNSNTNLCSNTGIIVTITPTPIAATNDVVTISTGQIAPQIVLENILSNDTLGGIPIGISDVNIYQTSSTASTYFNLDPGDGSVTQIVNNVPPGIYNLNYFICQIGAPNNCTQGVVTITVVNSLLTVVNGTYQDLNGDGITNVGDVINYTYSITNMAGSVITNISINSAEANINGGPPIPSLNPGNNNNSTYTGVHVITQEDINNGSVVVTTQTSGTLSGNPINLSTTNTLSLNIANGIRLNAFLDYNSNGTQESGEPGFTHGSFQYELNNNGTVHNINSSTGEYYLYETNFTNSYDLGFTIEALYASEYTVAPSSYPNVTVTNGSGIVTYNFAITALNPVTNLSVFVYSNSSPRPGFVYQNIILYQNNGNQTIASGTITFTNDNNVSISAYPPGATPTANGFTYNFTNLFPGQYVYLYVNLLVPTIPTVSLGDLITNTVLATVMANESNPNDNYATDTRVIVGSYDPNDKAESHGPQVVHSTFSANDYLTYTIRFENTGTAEAINIRVTDVLDSKLDETTVRMVTASHAYVLDRVGSNLTWRFDGVNLEPSIPGNPIIGHGYLVFQVKPKAGYVIGDIIPNTANIYFDFNPAIVTNTWSTTFVPFLGNQNWTFNNFTYYPNPVSNSLTISNNSVIDTVEIASVLGQKIKSITVNSLQTEIDLADLTTGMYFVKVTSNGQEKSVKILKE